MTTAESGWFINDPLASASGQFPLGSSSAALPGDGERSSGPATRPFGLRDLREMAEPKTEPYCYCHHRQLALASDGGLMVERMKLEWTTVTNNDGDEGPSEDYDWENVRGYAP
ncbi:MAG: putative ATP-grasp-modified RiPP [Actinomycetota bacterium]|nr:putative ATP-grasp-modified RiPP [Actinomycetota bacterium]